MSSSPARAARRTAVTLVSVAVLALLSAGPALAEPNSHLGPAERADVSSGLSGGEALLVFVGGPVAFVLVVAFIFGIGSVARSERYRPGKGWTAPPVWFAGPQEPVAAVEAASQSGTAALTSARGGASGDW